MTITASQRLAPAFNETFMAERRYLSALLEYFSAGPKPVNLEAIANDTGIPTGKSTGKVKPHIDYCRAMGLLESDGSGPSKTIRLSQFGAVARKEDPYLTLPLTQWLCHLQLCRRAEGADLWYQTFCEIPPLQGQCFSEDSFETFLHQNNSTKVEKYISPLMNMYMQDASFGLIGALTRTDDGKISLKSAPVLKENCRGYLAVFLAEWERWQLREPGSLGDSDQITLRDSMIHGSFLQQTLWKDHDLQQALEFFVGLSGITLDGKTSSLVITRLAESSQFFPTIYDDLA
jgi:hypothetical protein